MPDEPESRGRLSRPREGIPGRTVLAVLASIVVVVTATLVLLSGVLTRAR